NTAILFRPKWSRPSSPQANTDKGSDLESPCRVTRQAGGGVTLMPGAAERVSAQAVGPGWSYTGSLNNARTWHTATLLKTGKVLIAGGGSREYWFGGYSYSAELYDPASGTWNYTGSLRERRGSHTATLLQDGQVLVAGGIYDPGSPPYQAYLQTAELYDPVTDRWMPTGSFIA